MKYLLHLAYRGTNYHGWQRQPQHPSIQQTLEEALEKMLRQKVVCIGCGRTDTGVHASQYFAHIKLPGHLSPTLDPVKRLNQILPEDIAVFKCRPVPADFNAQHDASARSYTYHGHFVKNPFLKHLSGLYGHHPLDFGEMQKATDVLPAISDFRAMCKQPDLYKHTRCQLTRATLAIDHSEHRFRFDFTADRFLRNMVRLLVGNIIEIGTRRLSVEQFEDCLRSGERPPHFRLAKPEGLYLSGVKYERLK